jgi:hypothetical protein
VPDPSVLIVGYLLRKLLVCREVVSPNACDGQKDGRTIEIR